jgi:hypothetical protein
MSLEACPPLHLRAEGVLAPHLLWWMLCRRVLLDGCLAIAAPSLLIADSFALMYFPMQVQWFRFAVEGLTLSPFFQLCLCFLLDVHDSL